MRRVKLPTREGIGEVVLALLTGWEKPWDALRNTKYAASFSRVSKKAIDHALHGWSKPLSDSLGISPQGALLKVAKEQRECFLRHKGEGRKPCPLYNKAICHIQSPKMPWCFEPDNISTNEIRSAAAQAIALWREGVYLVIVLDEGLSCL
jgi:hypothetical protein